MLDKQLKKDEKEISMKQERNERKKLDRSSREDNPGYPFTLIISSSFSLCQER
ncbi:hypothetical protein [Desulfovulcanus sp.]